MFWTSFIVSSKQVKGPLKERTMIVCIHYENNLKWNRSDHKCTKMISSDTCRFQTAWIFKLSDGFCHPIMLPPPPCPSGINKFSFAELWLLLGLSIWKPRVRGLILSCWASTGSQFVPKCSVSLVIRKCRSWARSLAVIFCRLSPPSGVALLLLQQEKSKAVLVMVFRA